MEGSANDLVRRPATQVHNHGCNIARCAMERVRMDSLEPGAWWYLLCK